ncbi:hypothetical protein RSOLAG1IB_12321 [Rhizoctonia solani AG-1 IB]|uniref:Uncharacterized protein n=1 Tax=Thanatephorus cucumeris (strain AG1-IB / isolate 7/3/14) TaxID=1108050 RepID=A0A0B7FVG3_THACB|nr:hypothetical protein RSOLAG1IB_12321 [Rhizoctonia solani AG-1 IB]
MSVSGPQIIASGHNLRNGTALALEQVTRHLNLPLVQDVTFHMRKMAMALKAPKDNDASARELAEYVKQLMDVLDQASEHMERMGLLKVDGGDEVAVYLIELQELRDHLSQAHSELKGIQGAQFSTKLASQTHIRGRIAGIEKELWQNHIRLSVCTDAIVMHFLHATAQTQFSTCQLVRTLDRNCQTLTLQVNAMHALRHIDEQKIANLMLMNQCLIFF